MAYSIPLGKVTVPSDGTPVSLTSVLATLNLPANLRCSKLEFWPLLANTNPVYVGLDVSAPGNVSKTPMVKTTGVNVLRQLAEPAAFGVQDHFTVEAKGNVFGPQISQST